MKEKILEILSDKKPRDIIEISYLLGFDKKVNVEVSKELKKLMEEYEVYCSKKGRYMLFCDSEMSKQYIKGKFLDTEKEYGFVEIDDQSEDIFIHGSKVHNAQDGDIVLVHILKGEVNSRKCEGEIVKIISHEITKKVGEIYRENNRIMVKLDDRKVKKQVVLTGDTDKLNRLVDGDKIQVNFIGAKKDNYVYATLEKRIGNINDPDIEIKSALVEHNFNIEWPEDVLEQLNHIPFEVRNDDLKDRRDLRNEMIFTIDGDDTKDIDDAISIKKLPNGNYRLGVHIADVTYYVKENSPIDNEAKKRSTSVYLANTVEPMIPHQLSNGICSLNPNVDRLTITCDMEIDSKGNVVNSDIYPSVIRSRKQMTYKNVNKILDENAVLEEYEEYFDSLREMKVLADIIRENKRRRGCIDFETSEPKIIQDENNIPINVINVVRGSGEKLIEDFMIIANETIATTLFYLNVPCDYRVHDKPDEIRLQKFLSTLSKLGINIKLDVKNITPRKIQAIIDELKNHKAFKVLNTAMLSCMAKAVYQPENIGHFGIASKCYCHFTSPIRRYPDDIIHRILRDFLFSKDGITEEKINRYNSILPALCLYMSMQEINSVDCEREVEGKKMAEYMSYHIDEEYIGMISGVTKFGVFVQLDNMIEGLVPLLSLDELYTYDMKSEMLIANQSHKTLKLGDELKIKVVKASKEDGNIDFEIVERINNEKKKVKEFN